jgi:hypothetical protein
LVLALVSSRQTNVDWQWPGLDTYGSVIGGVAAALLFSTLALPLLSLATRHDAIRYE